MGFDAASMGANFGDTHAEAIATRQACCVFDFSFLHRARVEGTDAIAVLARLTRRPLADLEVGKVRYALRTDGTGHVKTDLTIWHTGPVRYEVFSGARSDIEALCSTEHSVVTDLSDDTAVLALQGPHALSALASISDVAALARLRYFECCEVSVLGFRCLVGRLGYTGEAGFEFVVDRAHHLKLWDALCRVSRPAGFEAADILRIEAGFPLFSHEFLIPVFPRELGMEKFGDDRETQDLALQMVAFRAESRERERAWALPASTSRDLPSGAITITSACYSPLAGSVLGLGFVRRSDVGARTEFRDPTKTFSNVRLTELPFYDPGKRRPRAGW